MTVREVYLPVCVTLHDGVPVSAQVDQEGAPWAYSNLATVYNLDTQSWQPQPVGDGDLYLVDVAQVWLGQVLGPPA